MSVVQFLVSHPFASICAATATVVGGGLGISESYSTQNTRQTWLFREVPENADLETLDNKEYESLRRVQYHYRKIIDGDKNYNGGNYVIYYGSEACSHCMGFLYGSQTIARGNKVSSRDKMSDGTWMSTVDSINKDNDLKDKKIKFLMYEDIPDKELSGKNSVYWTLPWATWPQDDFKGLGGKEGQYIRNDVSAIEFRKVFDVAVKRFGQKVSGTPTVIVYKEGVPKVFNQDTLPGLDLEKQGEDMSRHLLLKRFIRYYFLKTQPKNVH